MSALLADLLVGRRRVQRAVQLRRLAYTHLSRPLRALCALSHRPGVLQSRLAGLSGVPRPLPLLLGTFYLHEATARGIHSARLVVSAHLTWSVVISIWLLHKTPLLLPASSLFLVEHFTIIARDRQWRCVADKCVSFGSQCFRQLPSGRASGQQYFLKQQNIRRI